MQNCLKNVTVRPVKGKGVVPLGSFFLPELILEFESSGVSWQIRQSGGLGARPLLSALLA
jgi:hypothetical protein